MPWPMQARLGLYENYNYQQIVLAAGGGFARNNLTPRYLTDLHVKLRALDLTKVPRMQRHLSKFRGKVENRCDCG